MIGYWLVALLCEVLSMTDKIECDQNYCPFINFLREGNYSQNVQDVWSCYCNNQDNQKICKRREFLKNNMKEAPANMSPTGRLL